MTRIAGLLGLLLCGACALAQVPNDSARMAARMRVAERDLAWADTLPLLRFDPPSPYSIWKRTMEICSGRTRDGWPTFYVTNTTMLRAYGELSWAFYQRLSESVVFAFGQELRAPIVMHELLHWLIEPEIPKAPPGETREERAVRTHPAEVFEGACEPYVSY